MNTLYLECYSGISGDMTVAALLDLGADENALREGLASLGLDGYTIQIGQTKKCGITACGFDVIIHDSGCDHIHDHEQDHGHSHSHDCDHTHTHGCGHGHSHAHEHGHGHNHNPAHEHSHAHRGIREITEIIDRSKITDNAKTLAKKTFQIVADAEAGVHGLPVEEVHFHEVGAVDSIVDIVGAAICADNLDIRRVIATPLREGTGTVMCQHGRVPVPAPATLEITSKHGIPLVITQNKGEMVTPTGAAIVAALADSFDAPGGLLIKKTGYGAGKKDFETANVLRASLVELTEETGENGADVLEMSCNIDDMTGEQLACACGVLLGAGALDCWLTPAIMKKGRPAHVLTLLIKPAQKDAFAQLLFLHTSTIGVRYTQKGRITMNRETRTVDTKYGAVAVKESCYKDICKTAVEYESAKDAAKANDVPVNAVYREAEKQIK